MSCAQTLLEEERGQEGRILANFRQ